MSENHSLELRTRSIGPWPMHTYVFVCPTTRHSVLIDPGAEPETLMELLDGTRPQAILLTHTHPDHLGALRRDARPAQGAAAGASGPHVGDLVPRDRPAAGTTATRSSRRWRVARLSRRLAIPPICCRLPTCAGQQIVVGDTLFAGGPANLVRRGFPDAAEYPARGCAGLARRLSPAIRPRTILPFGRPARLDRGLPQPRLWRVLGRCDLGYAGILMHAATDRIWLCATAGRRRSAGVGAVGYHRPA